MLCKNDINLKFPVFMNVMNEIKGKVQPMMNVRASIGAIGAIVSLLRFFLVVFVIGGACLIFVT